jgi:hypothetical protein
MLFHYIMNEVVFFKLRGVYSYNNQYPLRTIDFQDAGFSVNHLSTHQA